MERVSAERVEVTLEEERRARERLLGSIWADRGLLRCVDWGWRVGRTGGARCGGGLVRWAAVSAC